MSRHALIMLVVSGLLTIMFTQETAVLVDYRHKMLVGIQAYRIYLNRSRIYLNRSQGRLFPINDFKVARSYSCMAFTTAVNNAAASQLLTIN